MDSAMQEKVSHSKQPNLGASWETYLGAEFNKPYMDELRTFLRHEKSKKQVIYPLGKDIFNAFTLTPFDKVKVVILGQDPYHGPNQAHGLSFSVRPGVRIPPSLMNIYKELHDDLGIKPASHGFLESWAKQGVLLLNNVLTVQAGQAASHQGKGWETFTDRAIEALNQCDRRLVFVLWGAHAQRKGQSIDESKHLVLKSVHPSPLSAHRGFFGSKPFSKINQFLSQQNLEPIQWALPRLS